MSLFVQFVRGLGAPPQRFWLCLEPIESVKKEELITLSVAGHYNSGQVELESVCLYYHFHFLSVIIISLSLSRTCADLVLLSWLLNIRPG